MTRQNRSIKFFTRTELTRILQAAKERSARNYAMILIGYRHGMRPSEVCKLLIDKVDLDNGHILVVRLKNSIMTWQRLPSDEVIALRAWMAVRPNRDSKYVFCSRRGLPIDRSQFYVEFREIAGQAGIPPERCRPHALKHSLGTHLAEGGIPVQIIQRRLGHRHIQNTMIYLSLADGIVDRAVAEAAEKGYVPMKSPSASYEPVTTGLPVIAARTTRPSAPC